MVRCINPKNYALTRNRQYETVGEPDGGYIRVINDRGITARYAQDLFRAEGRQVAERPAPAPLPQAHSLETIGDSVTVTAEDNNISITATISDQVTITVGGLSYSDTNISCGINQLWNLGSFSTLLRTELFSDNVRPLLERAGLSQEQVGSEIVKALVQQLPEILGCAMVLLSNTTDDPNFNTYWTQALEAYAWETEPEVNPNSDNEIKLWVISNALIENQA